jgi:hypothetical protein
MIRNRFDYELVATRARVFSRELALLAADEDAAALKRRAELRILIDEAQRALADYVSGAGVRGDER